MLHAYFFQAQLSINVLAEISGKTIYDIMAPHKGVSEGHNKIMLSHTWLNYN